MKIVGGFQAELEQLRTSAGFLGEGDAANLRTASQYLDWLGEGNVPDRFQEIPVFIDTGGPSIFPRAAPAESVPLTPPPSDRGLTAGLGSSEGEGSGRLRVERLAPTPKTIPVRVGTPPPPVVRPKLPSGRALPPEPPLAKAKANIGGEPASASVAPSVAPGVGPFVPLGLRTSVTSSNPLLRQGRGRSVSRTPRITASNTSSNRTEPSGSEEVVVAVAVEEEHPPIEPVPETPAPVIESPSNTLARAGPERIAEDDDRVGPESREYFAPRAVVSGSVRHGEGLLPSRTRTLISLDIHEVADKSEGSTIAFLQRALNSRSDIGIIFLSYAVIEATKQKATRCIERIAAAVSLDRAYNFPVIFTAKKV